MKLTLPAPAQALEIDAVMVDLDGTMVNTLGDFAESLNRMLADLRLSAIAPQAIEHMVGKGSEHLIRSVLAHVGAQDIDALYPPRYFFQDEKVNLLHENGKNRQYAAQMQGREVWPSASGQYQKI